jgi:uncharacterized membrane protein YccF (DUF307 family)
MALCAPGWVNYCFTFYAAQCVVVNALKTLYQQVCTKLAGLQGNFKLKVFIEWWITLCHCVSFGYFGGFSDLRT